METKYCDMIGIPLKDDDIVVAPVHGLMFARIVKFSKNGMTMQVRRLVKKEWEGNLYTVSIRSVLKASPSPEFTFYM